tara:strand:- start:4403 stop:5101 length:699 start_codon:yes stop_codon:yes gene_type:complete
MTKPHSNRIHTTLTSSSMTPRTAQSHLAYLATLTHPSNEEILYTEAKLALGDGDTTTARTLFNQCPVSYKRVQRYTKQIDTYDVLCTHGVIDRRDTLDVRVFLADIIGEETTNPNVVRYTDSLVRHGYNRRSLDVLTMASMDRCMDNASMSDGHRCLFEEAIAKRTPTLEFVFMTTLRAMERCGTVARCIKQTIPEDISKKIILANMVRDDEEEDAHDTGVVDEDEDETAED